MIFGVRPPPRLVLAITALLGLAIPHPLPAENLVSGSQALVAENQVIVHLSIANPAPANLIVETTVGTKGRIVATSPSARKVDNDSGRIKWLFKDARSGELTLAVTLTSPVEGGLSTIVRYRSPVDGSYQELRIAP